MDKGKSTIDHIPHLAMSSRHPRDYEEGVYTIRTNILSKEWLENVHRCSQIHPGREE